MHHWTHGLARLGELRVHPFEARESARVFLVSRACICGDPWRPPSTQTCIASAWSHHPRVLFINYLSAGWLCFRPLRYTTSPILYFESSKRWWAKKRLSSCLCCDNLIFVQLAQHIVLAFLRYHWLLSSSCGLCVDEPCLGSCMTCMWYLCREMVSC
jgi:hypothetical protein